jgi:molecular chaperone DnaK (HSP70)
VRALLEKRFPGKAIRGVESGINPDEVVARGAAIRASEADPESLEAVATVLVDVTGHTLSIEVMDQQLGKPVLFPLIRKETQIPKRAEHQFASHPNAPRSQIQVYQGEGTDPKAPDVTKIGEFLIDIDIIPEPTPLTVGLEINQDGLLVATARNDRTSRQVRCEINYKDSKQLTPQQVEDKRAEFEEQMNSVVGATANPLDEERQRVAPARSAAFAKPAAAAPSDPTASMNPIMRMLYQKALASFTNVPVDRQPALMTLVGQIEQAAIAGDAKALAGYYPELNKLMEGVA